MFNLCCFKCLIKLITRLKINIRFVSVINISIRFVECEVFYLHIWLDMFHYILYYMCAPYHLLALHYITLYYIMLLGLKINIRIAIAINISFGDYTSCRMWKSLSVYMAGYVSPYIILYYIICVLIATHWHYIIIAFKKEKRK